MCYGISGYGEHNREKIEKLSTHLQLADLIKDPVPITNLLLYRSLLNDSHYHHRVFLSFIFCELELSSPSDDLVINISHIFSVKNKIQENLREKSSFNNGLIGILTSTLKKS